MGKKSQAVGASWEQAVLDECALEQRRQRALIERRKPPMNILRSLGRGRFECVHAKKASVDFEGILEGGQVVRFDAKRSEHADRFSFSAVTDEQLALMARLTSLGAVCFLYVLHVPPAAVRRRRWIFPVDEAARIAGVSHKRSHELLVNETRESVRWDALGEELEIAPAETFVDGVLRLQGLGILPGARGAA